MTWKEREFQELCKITRGASPRPIQDWMTEREDGIPWIKISDANAASGRAIERTSGRIRREGEQKSITVHDGDLILSNSATPGIPKFVGIHACIHDGWLLLREFRHSVPEFLFYLLQYERRNIVSKGNGSVFTNLKTDILKSHKVLVPPILDQKVIAHILGTLDDKIELIQKMNQTLEEIAKAIFKSWFVDFGPVRAKAEGRPTGLPSEVSDLFPDELVGSEIGEIPKGWGIGSISEFALLHKKTVNPSQSEETFEHYSIPAFDNAQSPILDFGTDIKSNKNLVVEGSLLVSKLNPNTPRVWLPNPKSFYQQICSTEFMVYTSTDQSNIAFLWGLFTSSTVEKRMESMVTGTSKSHQRVKPNAVVNITTVVPDARLVASFGEIVLPMLKRLVLGRSESEILSELRDTLLPKLISGELRIPDAEKFLEEAGI